MREFPTREPNATISEIREVLIHHPDHADQCFHVYRDKPRVALNEIWIPSLGTWLRADGSSYNGDMGRPYVYPTPFGRMLLRDAIRKWKGRTGKWQNVK